MRISDRKSIIASTAALALMLGVLAGCNSNKTTETTASSSTETETSATEAASAEQVLPVVKVEKHRLDTQLELPGNLEAYQDVPLHAKVEGYISWIGVDRGSVVKTGQPLITVTAPELDAKVKEAFAKISSAQSGYQQAIAALESVKSKQVESQSKLDSDQLTLKRLKEAGQTPGAVAQNDIDMAQKTVEGDSARVKSLASEIEAARNLVSSEKNNVVAARSTYDAVRAMEAYLTIRAPFDGVITERNVHKGSIVAVSGSREGTPLLRIEQKNILRLVLAVPEASVSGIKVGEKIAFTVPAYLGKTFYGIVARPAHALDSQTRTMPVELNVENANGGLEPGMFATVMWNISRPYETMFLPQSAVATDLRGTFVVRVRNGITERVPVTEGQQLGTEVEVIGKLEPGDEVALKATDELKSGTKLVAKLADEKEIKAAGKHASAGGE